MDWMDRTLLVMMTASYCCGERTVVKNLDRDGRCSAVVSIEFLPILPFPETRAASGGRFGSSAHDWSLRISER